MDPRVKSERNFFKLQKNPYPGRGIVLGLDETGQNLVQVYWLMGRSENSRRIFVADQKTGRVTTIPADPNKVEDPSLTIYDAMLEERTGIYAVSNGSHTKDFARGVDIARLSDLKYEPDNPHFTPRILGLSHVEGPHGLIVWRKSPWSDSVENHLFGYKDVPPGIGMCIHTYLGDGDPLPSFRGEPYAVPLLGDAGNIAAMYWGALHADNRIALAVKTIDIKTGRSSIVITNRFEEVSA